MENEKTCTGRCELCSVNQRTYCSAQKAFYLEQDINEIKSMLSNIGNGRIETIVSKRMIDNAEPDASGAAEMEE